MAHSTTNTQTDLIASKEAAKIVGYSHDYISRLAREGQIIATRVGRQWHVDLSSLRGYIERNKLEQAARQEALREERRRELASQARHEQQEESVAVVAAPRQQQLALLNAFAVLAVGLLTGSFMFGWGDMLRPHESSNIPASSVTAQAVSSQTQPTNTEPVPTRAATSSAASTTNPVSLLLSQASSTEALERLVALHFSDVVDVEFTSATSGVIQPQFRERVGDRYHFMIPVEQMERWMQMRDAATATATAPVGGSTSTVSSSSKL